MAYNFMPIHCGGSRPPPPDRDKDKDKDKGSGTRAGDSEPEYGV